MSVHVMVDATEEPDVRTRVMNGVAVPSVDPEKDQDYYPQHKRNAIRSLRRFVRRGDEVVDVGGGWGACTVVAARMTHFEGEVTVFEPSSEMLETIERTITVNRVSDLISTKHAAIGPVPEVNERYFGPADGKQLSPEAVPECNVLHLDCEGAELAILESLEFTPRVIIVEVHPHLGSPEEDVKTELSQRGYEIIDRKTITVSDNILTLAAIQDGGV